MVIILKENPDKRQLDNLIDWLKSMGLEIHMSEGKSTTIMGLVGDTSKVDIELINALDIVETVKRIQEPYKNANRKFHPSPSVVAVGEGENRVEIGGGSFNFIAGPCSVESEEQICEIAAAVKASGATLLRGGAFKPRTSPYAFQGMRGDGIKLLLEAKQKTGLPIVSEVMDISQLPLFEEVDIVLSFLAAGYPDPYLPQRFQIIIYAFALRLNPILLKSVEYIVHGDAMLFVRFFVKYLNKTKQLCLLIDPSCHVRPPLSASMQIRSCVLLPFDKIRRFYVSNAQSQRQRKHLECLSDPSVVFLSGKSHMITNGKRLFSF